MSESPAAGLSVLIKTGAADAYLDEIQEAINQRRTFISAQAALAIATNDRIRVVPNPRRPHPTDNVRGVVTKINRSTVHVTLDRPIKGNDHWRFGAESLEVINDNS